MFRMMLWLKIEPTELQESLADEALKQASRLKQEVKVGNEENKISSFCRYGQRISEV